MTLTDSREKRITYYKNWRLKHKKEVKLYKRKWRLENPNYERKYEREHRIYHKKTQARIQAKRRELGSIILNAPFNGSEGHHIDKSHVIFIPESLHTSIPHNVWTGSGMAEINTEVYKWLGVIPL